MEQFLKKICWHRTFFVFFLFSLPFSIRKVFTVFTTDGSFNEYLDVSLYLSDVFFVLTVISYILNYKRSILSIVYWRKMFHVEHLLSPIFIPFFFIVWSGLSILWSSNLSLAIFSFSHLLEGYLLYVYVLLNNVPRGTNDQYEECSTWNKVKSIKYIKENETKMFHVEQLENTENVPRGKFFHRIYDFFFRCSTWNISQVTFSIIIISGLFQSIIAILQFIGQKSLGLSIFRESILSSSMPGVAKVIIGNEVFIRSYGFFPHPNILGIFLAVSLLLTIAYPVLFKFKMFHVEHSGNLYYKGIFAIQLVALLITFSKLAIVAFFFGLILLIFGLKEMFHVEQLENRENVPRGTFEKVDEINDQKCSTWNIQKSFFYKAMQMFHVEHLLILFGSILIILTLALFKLKFLIIQPISERLFYMNSFFVLFKVYFFEGLGIGQFVNRMQDFYDMKLLDWQFQPIHNVFLLILSEIGIVGFGLFIWFLTFVYLKNRKNVPRGTFAYYLVSKCSTWNKLLSCKSERKKEMFHVEHLEEKNGNKPPETFERIQNALLMRSIFIVLFFALVFDHYIWDIQQGQLLFWIMLAYIVNRGEVDK